MAVLNTLVLVGLCASVRATHLHGASRSSRDGTGKAGDLTKKRRPTSLRRHLVDVPSSHRCHQINNRGSYFSTDLRIGTPAQTFAALVDTGSRPLVVRTCARKASAPRGKADICFGTRRSSTFSLAGFNGSLQTTSDLHSEIVPVTHVHYGSGRVVVAIGSDTVSAGNLAVHIHDNLYLMVEHSLDIPPPEGILGLGPPSSMSWLKPQDLSQMNASSILEDDIQVHSFEGINGHGFLEAAGLNRFSLCLNSGVGAVGYIQFDTPPLSEPMTSMGELHWGLNLLGISALDAQGTPHAVSLFDKKSMLQLGQDRPCRAIPDTGSTFIIGPESQLSILVGQLCDAWPRCRAASQRSHASAVTTFQEVLFNCSDWAVDPLEIDAIPSFNLRVAGKEGEERTLTLPARAWVFQSSLRDNYVTSHPDQAVRSLQVLHGHNKNTVCTAAFGPDRYIAPGGGALWVLGMPLFLQYQISFDMSSPPGKISFSEAKCSSCSTTHGFIARTARGLRSVSSKGRARYSRDFHHELL